MYDAGVRAVVLHEPGPIENLRVEEIARPAPGPHDAIVRVRAEGVCYRDIVDRRGGFPFLKRPIVPGHEFAGEVVEVGAAVSSVRPGDRVVNLHRPPCGACESCRAGHDPRCIVAMHAFGMTADGGYAEYVLSPATALVPLPAEVSFEEGCFLACTAGVALRALRTRGGLRAGETVLVTGASGGVGLHALQVARALGARVLAVTSSEEKAQSLRAYGADDVIVSPDLAFHKDVKPRTSGGVSLVLDCVGAPTLNASLRSVRPMGRVVVVGNVTAERAEVNAGMLILNEVSLSGSSGCARADLLEVLEWTRAGTLRPVVADVLPLERAAEAQRRLEQKAAVGRIVLRP